MWKNRIVGHGEQAASQFMANPLNWRVHSGAQRGALTGILSDVGWVQSVIVNRVTGNVVDGHARIEEALKLGDDTPVPFIEVELTEEEEKKILLTFDPISAMAVSDKENLDALLNEVSVENKDLQAMLSDLASENGLQSLLEKDKEIENKYTKTITSPIYEITGKKPPIELLYDDKKAKQIIEEINNTENIPNDVKNFLVLAAMRHVVFNYKNIAEYYAHSSKEVQQLFENSALVIIDFERAIELGYVNLSRNILNQYEDEHE